MWRGPQFQNALTNLKNLFNFIGSHSQVGALLRWGPGTISPPLSGPGPGGSLIGTMPDKRGGGGLKIHNFIWPDILCECMAPYGKQLFTIKKESMLLTNRLTNIYFLIWSRKNYNIIYSILITIE
jgi:hypothetical protein